MPSDTLLITGGAGYIGSHTVRHLLEQHERVVVLDNLVFGHRDALPADRVTLVEGDMADAALVERVFAEHAPEAVLHFAAFAYVGESVTDPLKYYRNNLAAPLTLLEAMQRHACRRFIFSSTCATYGDPVRVPIDESHPQSPVNPYGASKWMLERVLRDCDTAWGLKSVFLRYFNASGCHPSGEIGEDHDPETHLIPLVLQAAAGKREHITIFGTDYPTPDGTCIRDYVHVTDLAEAHVLALEAMEKATVGVRAYNLGNAAGTSVLEVIRTVERVSGKRVNFVVGARRPGDPPRLVGSSARILAELGWKPRFGDIETIVQTAWRWHERRPDGYGDRRPAR